MTDCEYLITDSELAPMLLSEVGPFCQAHAKKVVGQVEIQELARLYDWPHGVYLFYKAGGQSDELVYVGKATSRSFIERIPAHFDPREEAWMNSLTKKVRSCEKGLDSYQDALSVALTLKLLLLGVKEPTSAVRLESILRSFLAPRYNKTSPNPRYSGPKRLSELLALIPSTHPDTSSAGADDA
jgi:hypothetical protein